ncbi:hypothetical protein QBC45DRAFT_388288 [Copromyces sp. CBS 386.78]|nr:hypothetical protein QBC45DRAFT_388288 [Copromyces sp. CBS 386.78]
MLQSLENLETFWNEVVDKASSARRQSGERLKEYISALPSDAGADLERSDDYRGWTALFGAVERNKKDNVALLLKMGANPKNADDDGRTPLLYDADIPVYELLLDAGADIEYESPSGETALLAQDYH